MERKLIGRVAVPGTARGRAVISEQPLSLWGGLDPATGEIIDRRHDWSGTVVTGRVLVLPRGKGSSTSSAILLEAIRTGNAPAAIINRDAADPILALGAIVADELYHRSVPLTVLGAEDFAAIEDGDLLSIEADGAVCLTRSDCGALTS